MDIIAPLSDLLKQDPAKSPTTYPFLTPVQHHHLTAIHIAAYCLYDLEEYDDCLSFLEPFVSVEDDTRTNQIAAYVKHVVPNQASAVNVMAGEGWALGVCIYSG